MKKKMTILGVFAAATVVGGCMGAGYGGPGVGAGPQEEAPVYETQIRYVGTAPFCGAKRGDCYNLGEGWEFDSYTKTGGGATCSTGNKVKCTKRVRIN